MSTPIAAGAAAMVRGAARRRGLGLGLQRPSIPRNVATSMIWVSLLHLSLGLAVL